MQPADDFSDRLLDNPTTWNRYAYTDGDPVNNFDPTGLDDEDCRKTLSVINRRVYGNTSDKLQPAKGLVQRYNEQIYGNYGPGSTQWALHNTIIQQVQGGVKQLMKKYIDDKCPPPSNWKHTDEWVNRPLPTNREYKGPTTMFFDPLPIIIDDILEYLPLIADAGTTSVDDTVSYDMSPYGGAGEVADTGGDGQTASVDSTIWYDMSPYMGAGGGGVYSSFDPVEN